VTNVKKPSPIYYQQLLIRDKAKEDFDKIKDYADMIKLKITSIYPKIQMPSKRINPIII
jgi:hypothetical protein